MTRAEQMQRLLRANKSTKHAESASRYFKTGEGQYGQHDRFIGVKMPEIRAIAKEHRELDLEELHTLLQSAYNEERMLALVVLVDQYKRASSSPEERQRIFDFYLQHTRCVNNWNLVDGSCYFILGEHLIHNNKDRSLLYTLADSADMWERRIAIVSTMAFVRRGDLDDTFALAEKLLRDEHDLIHKAVGWLVKEAGKRDEARLTAFLDRHAADMPRTMLRCAVEKLSANQQKLYMNKKKQAV